MAASSMRFPREPGARGPERSTLVCTLTGSDGQAVGTLTLDLSHAQNPLGGEEIGLLRAGAAVFARALRENHGSPGRPHPRRDGSAAVEKRPEMVIHAALSRGGAVVDEHHFSFPFEESQLPGGTLGEMVAAYERGLIEDALRTTRGNRARAARLLKTTERILGYRIQQYAIDPLQFRS